MYKDTRGVIINPAEEPAEIRKKRIASCTASWKKRDEYIADIKVPAIYNSWRAMRFTVKGRSIGNDPLWDSYRNFYNDVYPTYQEGYTLQRSDKNLPFSQGNFIWCLPKFAHILKRNSAMLAYGGKNLTLGEWAEKLGLSLNGIKARYYRGKNHTTEEILFGKIRKPPKPSIDASRLHGQRLRDKASKMVSSYRHKDAKMGYVCTLTIEWMIDNILFKRCSYCGTDQFIGCDRIDNSKGHTTDNVVPCCKECNTARGDNFTPLEMNLIGEAIAEVRRRRGAMDNDSMTLAPVVL